MSPPTASTYDAKLEHGRPVAKRINCSLVRGGTSRGPIISLADILALYPHYHPSTSSTKLSPLADPNLHAILDQILPQIVGTGNPLQIDGVGGGSTLTSKAAVVCPSTSKDADVDYLFAQVSILGGVTTKIVDYSPNCGNIMSAVGVYALEHGMISSPPSRSGERSVIIRNVNTNRSTKLDICPPPPPQPYSRSVPRAGPGEYSILLSFPDVLGSKTGRLLPSNRASEEINGKHVSLVDAAVPVVFLLDCELGLDAPSGWSHSNTASYEEVKAEIEEIRLIAGHRMGLGDVSNSVIPKVCIVGPPAPDASASGADISVLYLTPHAPHASVAVTGALCTLVASSTAGTIPNMCAKPRKAAARGAEFGVGHPGGVLALEAIMKETVNMAVGGRLVRTARTIFEGSLDVWVDQ